MNNSIHGSLEFFSLFFFKISPGSCADDDMTWGARRDGYKFCPLVVNNLIVDRC